MDTVSAQRDWPAIGLGRWKEINDSFMDSAEEMCAQYKESETIPPQQFSALFRMTELYFRGQELSLFKMLPAIVRDELIEDHHELFRKRQMTYAEKYEWLNMLHIYIKETEDLLWTCLGGF